MAADIPDLHAVEVNFDGITYAKGASVLKQLVAYVGLEHVPGRAARLLPRRTPSTTRRSTICWARWRRPRAATCRDWGRQWLKTTGLNTLRADFDVDDDGRFTRFAIAPGRCQARRR